METNTLQMKILEAKKEMSGKSLAAIDAVNWHQIILGMNTKFNSDQIDTLQTETELLLCGLVSTADFSKELEARMMISRAEVEKLLEDMNNLIFKKMQEELEKRLGDGALEKGPSPIAPRPMYLDPKFAGIPQEVQMALANSNWKENLYTIAKKYELSIDKMAALEDITSKTITGKIRNDKFEEELKNLTNLPNDKLKELVAEINTSIFVNIKKTMMGELASSQQAVGSSLKKTAAPLPPYKVSSQQTVDSSKDKLQEEIKVPIPPLPPQMINENIAVKKVENAQDSINNILSSKNSNIENDMYREHGIEIMGEVEKLPNEIIKSETFVRKENPVIPNKVEQPVSNIISDKLFNKTASKTVVTDYSIPKINPVLNPISTMSSGTLSKPHDPYHEEI